MSFGDVFRNLTNRLNGNSRISNEQNTKEAEKNIQQNQMQYLDYEETPDEEPILYSSTGKVLMYAIYPDKDVVVKPDKPEESIKKYAVPEYTVEKYATPRPTQEAPAPTNEPIVAQPEYAAPMPTFEPSPAPTINPSPSQSVNLYNPWQGNWSIGQNPHNPWNRPQNPSWGKRIRYNIDDLRQNLAQTFTNLFIKPATYFSQRVGSALNNFFAKWWS